MFLDKINGLISYLDSPSLTGFYKEQKRIYSISSDLSAVSAPDGTGRHWGQATPAPTGPDRHRPIQTGAGPDRTQLAWTGTSLRPVCAGPYRVSNDLCRSMSIVKHRHRPWPRCWCRGEIARNGVS